MARTKTYSRFKKHHARLLVAMLVVVLLCGSALFASRASSDDVKMQGTEAIKAAVLSNAKQCAAIEGAYPVSLQYLEDKYGLVIDHQHYIVNYEVFAQNVMPSVTVVPR